MSMTPSNMLPLETHAPYFSLQDTISNKTLNLDDLKGKKGTVIMFICNHCPFVIHINSKIASIANSYQKKEIAFIAISSNDVLKYPQDSPENMKTNAKNNNFTFPYLYDESQEVAKAYDAACTPDFYVFNANLKLTYRGQFDNSRPNNEIPVTGEHLKHALDCLIKKEKNTHLQKPSIGCNIKWK